MSESKQVTSATPTTSIASAAQSKPEQLEQWIDQHKALPSQGSIEWVNGRKYRIGGSEVATIEGTNSYSTIIDLVKEHVGLTSFKGNTATRWGSILEDITVDILEQTFGIKIYVPGSIPHPRVEVHANSPDGIAYIREWDRIILFEIKNPLSRIPGGVVPKSYRSQIQSGMSTIPIVDHAIFADHMQRKCELAQLIPTSVEYDTVFHNPRHSPALTPPLALTVLGVYRHPQNGICMYDKNRLIDYGMATTSRAVFDHMLTMVTHRGPGKEWFIHYGTTHVCVPGRSAPTPVQWVTAFIEYCKANNVEPVGVLPLKTFRMSLISLYRNPPIIRDGVEFDYIDQLAPQIREVVANIRLIDAEPTDHDKLIALGMLYPKKDDGAASKLSVTTARSNPLAQRSNYADLVRRSVGRCRPIGSDDIHYD